MLQENEEKYDHVFKDDHYVRQLWDSPLVGLALIDEKRIIHDVNHSFCDILRRGKHDIMGRDLDGLSIVSDRKADHYLLDGVKNGDLPSFERRKKFHIDDDRTIDVLVGVRSIRDKDHTFVCFCVTVLPLDVIRTRENVVVQYVPTISSHDLDVKSNLDRIDQRLNVAYKIIGITIGGSSLLVGLCVSIYYIVKVIDYIRMGVGK